MAATRFILIHGLAWKPDREILLQRYVRYLSQGIGQPLDAERIQLAYWADLMDYDALEIHRDEYIEGHHHFEGYSLWEMTKGILRGAVRTAVVESFESSLSAAIDGKGEDAAVQRLLGALPAELADGPAGRLYGRLVPDMKKYFFEGRRQPVLQRLGDQINASDAPICLIAHSMGSIIALDYLMNDANKVETLITIGSPLGLRVVKDHLGVSGKFDPDVMSRSVKNWFNLYDRLDPVSLDTDLADDFDGMDIADIRIRNEFVDQKGNRNYHKSYGYLRSPEMAEIIQPMV